MLRAAYRTLQTEQSALVQDVVDGKRFFWLGSGISRNEVPDVVDILTKVLIFLRDRAVEDGPNSPHRNALLEILTEHLNDEVAQYQADEANWYPQNCEPLRNVYSEIFSTAVDGKNLDYLMLTAADIPNTYGRNSLQPGISHKFLAILIAEGVLIEIASGNWDGLVEAAVQQLTDNPQDLGIYVTNEDLRESNAPAHIAKFHGCAVLAKEQPENYAPLLIATRAQISRFETEHSFQHMRDALKERTRRYRSLVLGLSLQDTDLLNVFTRSAQDHPWRWESDHPAYLFAEPELKSQQRDMLQNSYPEAYALNRAEITDRSAIGSYAGPILAALTLQTLTQKLIALIKASASIDIRIEQHLSCGIQRVETLIAAAVGDSEYALYKFITGPYTRIVKIYQGHSSRGTYVPLARGPRPQISSSPETTALGSDLFAAAIGLIGWGEIRQRWKVRLSAEVEIAALELISPKNKSPIKFSVVRSAVEADAILNTDTWINGPERFAVMYTAKKPRSTRRSAASTLGSGRRRSNRPEIYWSSIMDGSLSVDELMQRLETEMEL